MSHSVLSASASHHWKSCIASVIISKDLPDIQYSDGSAAREGTALHALIEEYILTGREDFDVMNMEQEDGTFKDVPLTDENKSNVADVIEAIKNIPGAPLAETRVHYGKALGVDDKYAFGTCDVNNTKDGVLYIADAKFGRMPVSPYRNPQLACYAAGMLERYDIIEDFSRVVFMILQPKISTTPKIWETTPAEVQEIMDELKPAAKRIIDIYENNLELTEDDYGTDCKFCNVVGIYNLKQVNIAKKAMATRFKADIKDCLEMAEALEPWIRHVKSQALSHINNGGVIEGYKMVEGRPGNRAWMQSDTLIEDIRSILPNANLFSDPVLLSPAQIEKQIDKKGAEKQKIKDKLIELQTRPAGKPTLVKATDERPPYADGVSADDFDII